VLRKIFGILGCSGKYLGEYGAEENIWEKCAKEKIWDNLVQRKIFGRIGCRGKYLGK
jgi:hypothetical protein